MLPEIVVPLTVPAMLVAGNPNGLLVLDESDAESVVPMIVPLPVNALLPELPVIDTILPS